MARVLVRDQSITGFTAVCRGRLRNPGRDELRADAARFEVLVEDEIRASGEAAIGSVAPPAGEAPFEVQAAVTVARGAEDLRKGLS